MFREGTVDGRKMLRIKHVLWVALCAIQLLAGCDGTPWNSPYTSSEEEKPILFSSFTERPKHLDPARSYNENEALFISQIYEPPLQYHFLKRPYELIPLTAVEMPQVTYLDKAGNPLTGDYSVEEIAYSDYLVRIQPGIQYQPHPLFARTQTGEYLYHRLSDDILEEIHTLSDFTETGSRELTADDYVYQIKRMAFPRFHCPIVTILNEYVVGFEDLEKELEAVDEKIKKETGEARPYVDLRPYRLEGVEVVDRYSYRVRINGKYPQFLYWMAMSFFAPMPWEADRFYAQEGLWKRNIKLDWFPVGTGPFMLSENNPNLRMVLERNPNFHGETYPTEGEAGDEAKGYLIDAGKPLPLIDRAVYSLEKENIPYWNKFLQGYYDTSGVSSDSFDQAVQFGGSGEVSLTDDMKKRDIHLDATVRPTISYFGFNMRDPVVGGDSERARLLRQAISIAVDYEEFISIFNNGRGVVAHSPIPPGIFGHHEGLDEINPYVYRLENGKAVRRSIDEAKALLAKADYADGKDPSTGQPLLLYFDVYATGPDSRANLNWWRKQFNKLGIQLVVRNTDYNRFQEKMRKGTSQLYVWGWNADYPDPENFLFLLFGPNSKVDVEGENSSNYANAEYDRLFKRMKHMENTPERQVIIDRMVEILRHDAPWIWGYFPKAFSLHHDWFKNSKPTLMVRNKLKYRRVDPELRHEKQLEWNPPIIWPVVLVLFLLLLSLIPAVKMFRNRERSSAR